jgi:hypothetical protein
MAFILAVLMLLLPAYFLERGCTDLAKAALGRPLIQIVRLFLAG